MQYEQMKAQYLSLLRKCLTREIFEDGSTKPFNLEHTREKFDPYKRERGLDWPQHAETMIGVRRLKHLHTLLESVRSMEIGGHYAECGIWRGGTCIYAKEYFEVHDMGKKVYGFDSFEGLPEGGRYEQDRGDTHHTMNQVFAVSQDEVWSNFRKYGVETDGVILIKGWFSDSLPAWRQAESPLCILRIDGDMYEGTIDPLRFLEHSVVKGGYVVIDDYGAVRACREAVHDYRDEQGITDEIKEIDQHAVFWRKS